MLVLSPSTGSLILRIPSWRFRLSTLLLVITVTALGLALFLARQKQQELVAENRELREELRRPVITDSQRIAVGPDLNWFGHDNLIDSPVIERHEFRVHCPPGRKLAVYSAFENIDGAFPDVKPALDLSSLSGEVLINMVVTIAGGNLSVRFYASQTNADGSGTSMCDGTPTRAPADHWLLTKLAKEGMLLNIDWEAFAIVPKPPLTDTPLQLVRYTIYQDFKSPKESFVLAWLDELK